MPSNRFDTSVQQQYVSQYVPMPFEAIGALGAQTQKAQEEGAKAIDDLGALGATIKSAPMYESHRTKFINEYNEKIKNLVDEAKGDYGSPDFKRKVSNLTTEFKARPEINAFANTLKSYQDWETEMKKPENQRSLDYTYQREGTGFKPLDVLKQGIYSPKYTKYEDWDKGAKEAVGNIKDSGSDKEFGIDFSKPTIINNGETQVYSNVSKGYIGVTSPQVQQLSKLLIPNYASKSSGKHHLETILKDDLGFGDNAYDLSYEQINKQALIAQDNINKGQGTSDDNKLVEMKKYIDGKLSNFIFAANASQIGGVEKRNIDYMQVTDRMAQKGNDLKDLEAPKNPWNMYTPNANPDPNNAVATALRNANPNSVFKVSDNGQIEDVKPTDVGTKSVQVYKDLKGNIWNPQNPPKGWSYKKDSWGGDYFESTGGTKVKTASLQSDVQTISNLDIYAKQVQEVFQWAASTGQFEKGKSGPKQYDELLPKYKAAIKNGALNSHYLPQFDAETAANFKEVFAPKLVTTANGTTIKDAGLVSNWSIEGVSTNEEKMKILNNFNPVGLDMIKGGDNILISSAEDGKEYSVNMNNPTLKSTFNELSRFIRENNTAKINPTKVNPKQIYNATATYLENMTNEAVNLAKSKGLNPTDAQNETMLVTSTYINKANNLTKNGYVPTASYQDPTTGTIAISYINHATPGGQDVKVLKFHPGVDNEFEETSEASFNREVQQKALGNFASNLNVKGSKTSASFIENQNPKK